MFASFKRLKGFFQDCTSFNIAIDLLFIKENFEGKSDIYVCVCVCARAKKPKAFCYRYVLVYLLGALNLVKEMKTQGVAFNKDTYTLAFATCYKLVCVTLI